MEASDDNAREAQPGHAVHGPVHGPVDPDVTPDDVAQSEHEHSLVRGRGDVLAVIAVGGALGSAARYGVAQLVPSTPGQIPWSTFTVNVVGCFLIGVLMVFVADVWPPRRYIRPFLGVGVLGGFTTFSTYALDARHLIAAGRAGAAALYVVGTLLVGLGAVLVGALAGRVVTRSQRAALEGAAS